MAFAFEKNIDGMTNRPHNLKSGLFNPLMKFLIIFNALLTSSLLFTLYWLLLRNGFDEKTVRTFIFASFGTYTLFSTFALRSLQKSIFTYRIFSNRYLVGGVGIGVTLMGAAVYFPPLQSLFDTVSLPPSWLLGVTCIGVLNIATIEFGKWVFRRRENA